MYRIELQRVDGELAAIFPAPVLERINAAEGDVLYLFERGGEIILSANAPAPGEQSQARLEGVLDAHADLAERCRNTLRGLGR